MQLFVRGQNLHTFEVTGGERVFDIKNEIALVEGLPADEQVLFYAGTPLDDELSLSDCGLVDLCTLEVGLRLLGGKVHGSLARAGKVKGQTPKVEKQEKKKKKVGRAKRRIQYNRRFVNVVAGFGKRRGPNSNAP
ncbi:PREDICTED: ubiquitin-like protein FUBI [Acropora digitifera]|uniref:ubiquitin-like protein FUBI n=1 Tax=Acropora digitifera TaxID=70779 RepID=UPI00077A359C|nr:PREDICTED: ubiquitin-like protein FUBI [Acropora digitifera]XP_015773804.1 PREDICTED: ubiquitin-like protein FUBI [Acropora digitifera]